MTGINVGGAGIRVSGGGSNGFTPVYGGWYFSGTPSIANTTVTTIGTDYTIATNTIAAKANNTGVTIIAGGGIKNSSGSAGYFEYTFNFSNMWSNDTGQTFNFGCRVREIDDITLGAINIGISSFAFTANEPLSVSFTCYVYLEDGETVFGCARRLNGSGTTLVGICAASMRRIA